MRIQIISDIHCEFHRDGGKQFCESLSVITPVLVIAGDFGTYDLIIKNVKILVNKFEHVVYVCGNHEYYGATRGLVNQTLTKLSNRYKNFHWLNNSMVEIQGQRFLGSTMWFRDKPDNFLYHDLLNDFSCIRGYKKWVYSENKKAVEYFESNVREGDIVITHHAPSTLSIDESFKFSDTNRFYFCDMSELIYQRNPAFWVHGHMHKAVSYPLYNTWVESNPFGYVGHAVTPSVEDYVKVLET
jgi:Icc-related predicted phosphoesterase